jgi:micrococcal nuclease
LASDPTDSDRDKYRRLLRYVFLPDGTFLNQFLVEQGYAFAYVIFPNVKLDQFKTWEAEAHAANRGLWAHCTVDSSTDIKQTNSIGPVPTN